MSQFSFFRFIKEDDILFKLIAEKAKTETLPFDNVQLCLELAKTNDGDYWEPENLNHRIWSMPWECFMQSYDADTQVKILFGVGATIDSEKLEELKKDADVVLNKWNQIIKYEKKGGGLKLEGEHTKMPKDYFLKLVDKMIEFLAEKSKNVALTPMTDMDFIEEFKASTGCSDDEEPLSRGYSYLKRKIHDMGWLDWATQVKMIFLSGAKVNEHFLEDLRKYSEIDFIVEMDNEGRMTKFEESEGSLTLAGVHRSFTKVRKEEAEKETVVEVPKVAEKAEEVKKRVTRRQIRLSALHDDEVDPNIRKESNSSKKKRESEAKNEQKTVKSTQSSNLTPKIDNKKRKLVESSSTAKTTAAKVPKIGKSISSASKIPEKPAKKSSGDTMKNRSTEFVNTQKAVIPKTPKKSAKKSEKSQGNDVIFDGGEVPLPIQLPKKTEQIEYQEQIDNFVAYTPPMEFGNSQLLTEYPTDRDVKQEDMEQLEAIRDASFVPVNSSHPAQSAENTVEMTSSKEILKLLRSLVRSLDSPMLADFQEEIENAMRAEDDNKIPLNEIITALNIGLSITTRHATSTPKSADSTSLKEFIRDLRCCLFSLNTSAIDDFQEKIKEIIGEIGDQNKTVPIPKIRLILETVLALVN